MTDELEPPVPIGSSKTRFDRISETTRAKVRVDRRGAIRVTLEIGPYVVPATGAEVVPIRGGVDSTGGGEGEGR